jgi:hypothetical protein
MKCTVCDKHFEICVVLYTSDQKENKSTALARFLFYRNVRLGLGRTHNYTCYAVVLLVTYLSKKSIKS